MSKTDDPIRIASRRELFVDDTLIERFGDGDALDQAFAWNGNADVSALAGQPVCLRFDLKGADVFAMQFVGKHI